MNFIFLIISILVLIMNAFFFFYSFFSGKLILPDTLRAGKAFLFKYNFWTVISAIFLLNIYVVLAAYTIIQTFEKTQANEVLFFLVFLASLLFDSARLYIPIYGLAETYSKTLIRIGNFSLTARLLAPLSLFALAALSTEEFRQKTEQLCVGLILVAVFFAAFLPLNTAVILPNLCVSYGFTRAIHVFTVLMSLISLVTLFFHNKRNDFNQLHTLGFLMITIGYYMLFSCSNLFTLILGAVFLGAGSALYLIKLHQHYLWID